MIGEAHLAAVLERARAALRAHAMAYLAGQETLSIGHGDLATLCAQILRDHPQLRRRDALSHPEAAEPA